MFLWKHWGENQNYDPKFIAPENEEELIKFIKKAKKENYKVRAYGSAHSHKDIVYAKDYLVNTDKFNNIISVDKDKNLVRVQAGIKLNKLNEDLAAYNLSLKNQAQITHQSLAGAVCTSTHGSGKTGSFSSFVKEVKLLTSDGMIYNISDTENKNLFGAARTNLGTLGIITEYSLEFVPLFKVEQKHIETDWKTILSEYSKLLENNDYMEFTYHIRDDSVKIRTNNIVDINTPCSNNVDYSYKMLTGNFLINFLPSESIYFEEEIAIPIKNFLEAAHEFYELLKKYFRNQFLLHVLFRFVNAENQNWLSPASDRDVVYFSVTTPAEKVYEDFFKNFYKLMLKYDGRPHWAKLNYLTKEDVQKIYRQNYNNFIEARKILDPNNMFSNDFTERIFGHPT